MKTIMTKCRREWLPLALLICISHIGAAELPVLNAANGFGGIRFVDRAAAAWRTFEGLVVVPENANGLGLALGSIEGTMLYDDVEIWR